MRESYLLLFVCVAFVTLLLLIEGGVFNGLFKSLGVYPEPEYYSALFFKDPDQFSEVQQGKNDISEFTFGVYNHENSQQNYPFSVIVYSGDKTIPVINDSVVIENGETGYYTVQFDEKDYPTNSIVYVTLLFHQKSIDFKLI